MKGMDARNFEVVCELDFKVIGLDKLILLSRFFSTVSVASESSILESGDMLENNRGQELCGRNFLMI
jgi:hypothetical protein